MGGSSSGLRNTRGKAQRASLGEVRHGFDVVGGTSEQHGQGVASGHKQPSGFGRSTLGYGYIGFVNGRYDGHERRLPYASVGIRPGVGLAARAARSHANSSLGAREIDPDFTVSLAAPIE